MTELQHLIYEQLLELYIFDLETEEYPSEVATYSEEWDAWYDPNKNEWLERTCDDPTCEYCVNRPERPL